MCANIAIMNFNEYSSIQIQASRIKCRHWYHKIKCQFIKCKHWHKYNANINIINASNAIITFDECNSYNFDEWKLLTSWIKCKHRHHKCKLITYGNINIINVNE